MVRFGTKEELGRCIGKEFRASLAIVDENLAKAVEQKLAAFRSQDAITE
jgi:ribosomal protein L7Ae-like RNA K-turn-binding protein